MWYILFSTWYKIQHFSVAINFCLILRSVRNFCTDKLVVSVTV